MSKNFKPNINIGGKNMINSFEELLMNTYEISGDYRVEFPLTCATEVLSPRIVPESEKHYCKNNGVIVFQLEGVHHVIPSLAGVERILQNEGFTMDYNMYVPFSSGSMPATLAGKVKWNSLLEMKVNEE